MLTGSPLKSGLVAERPYGCTCTGGRSPSLTPTMLNSSKSYEVTIEGIGPRPYVDCFEAPSPGLAKLAAQDKFGRWIKVTEVKELPAKKLKLVKSTPKPRRRAPKQSNSRTTTEQHRTLGPTPDLRPPRLDVVSPWVRDISG